MKDTRLALSRLAHIAANVRRMASRPADTLAMVALVVLIFMFQHASGAYQQDFSGNEDEPSHVVSSLMVRDYLAEGLPGNPLHFAEKYYVHYPKIAIGHWPPLFYAGEAVWMLIFGRTRTAMLMFVAASGALLATSVFVWLRNKCGTLAAFLSAAMLISTPVFRNAAFTVEPDILLALLAFWAAIACGVYFEHRRARYAWSFAIITICAVLIHGRGAMLFFVAPLEGLLMERKGRKAKWLLLLLAAGAVALVLPRLLGQADASSLSSITRNAWIFLCRLCISLSWPVVLIAVIGAIYIVRSIGTQSRWIAMLALLISGWLFQSLVDAPMADRYLLTVAPAVTALFAAGLQLLSDLLARGIARPRLVRIGLAILACFIIVNSALVKTIKSDTGFHRLSKEIGISHGPTNIYLVAGDALHEGALIAEMALSEPLAQHVVLRASKVLATSSWSGRDYHLRFATSDALESYLDDAHVSWIFAQERSLPKHIQLLREDVLKHAQQWTPVLAKSGVPEFEIFRRTGAMPPGKPKICIDMRDKLGTYLKDP